MLEAYMGVGVPPPQAVRKNVEGVEFPEKRGFSV